MADISEILENAFISVDQVGAEIANKPELIEQIQNHYLGLLPEKNLSVDDTHLERDLTEYDRGWNACRDQMAKNIRRDKD